MDLETEERIASLEAQVQQLLMMQMMASDEDNGMLGEVVEPLPIASGGGGDDSGCFRISKQEDNVITLKNCFVMVGGKFYDMGEEKTETLGSENLFVFVKINMESETFEGEVSVCKDASAFSGKTRSDKSHFHLPLYEFSYNDETESYGLKRDFRNIPIAPTFELED